MEARSKARIHVSSYEDIGMEPSTVLDDKKDEQHKMRTKKKTLQYILEHCQTTLELISRGEVDDDDDDESEVEIGEDSLIHFGYDDTVQSLIFPTVKHQEIEETMDAKGKASAEDSSSRFETKSIWQSWRTELLQHRLRMRDLLRNWGTQPYEQAEMVIDPYLHLLYTTDQHIHKDRSDVEIDFGILKDLQIVLEHDIVVGEKNYIQFQIAVIYAHKKLGMMLQQLHRILEEGILKPDDDFRKWIQQQLHNENWEGYLEFVCGSEPEVLKKANVKGVKVETQIISLEEIKVENPDDIKKRLMVYRKELEDAHNKPKDNVDCIAHGPHVCEFIKEIMCQLSSRYSVKPDEDIKHGRKDEMLFGHRSKQSIVSSS